MKHEDKIAQSAVDSISIDLPLPEHVQVDVRAVGVLLLDHHHDGRVRQHRARHHRRTRLLHPVRHHRDPLHPLRHRRRRTGNENYAFHEHVAISKHINFTLTALQFDGTLQIAATIVTTLWAKAKPLIMPWVERCK